MEVDYYELIICKLFGCIQLLDTVAHIDFKYEVIQVPMNDQNVYTQTYEVVVFCI